MNNSIIEYAASIKNETKETKRKKGTKGDRDFLFHETIRKMSKKTTKSMKQKIPVPFCSFFASKKHKFFLKQLHKFPNHSIIVKVA